MDEKQETKTLAEWELERGYMVLGKVDVKQELTADEFTELVRKHDYLPVDQESRKQRLESLGIKPTRENMLDTSISNND